MFIKEKRDSTLKAGGCADRILQRQIPHKEGASSWTMSLEAMIMSCTIDVKEGRYVIVTDIP